MVMDPLLISSPVAAIATASSILVGILALRIVQVVGTIQGDRRRSSSNNSDDIAASSSPSSSSSSTHPPRRANTMVVLGSGGHTTEMMRLLGELDSARYGPVCYVVADSDTTSIPRLAEYVRDYEEKINFGNDGGRRSSRWEGRRPAVQQQRDNDDDGKGEDDANEACAKVYRLPRAREVGQSYPSSVLTTMRSFVRTFILLCRVRPELILANGPGTCVPVIYSAFLLRLLPFLPQLLYPSSSEPRSSSCCRVVFVESLCRVRTLSLSGRLVYPVVDRFVVHWPGLSRDYPLAEVCDVFVPS